MHLEPVPKPCWAFVAWLVLLWSPSFVSAWPVHLDSEELMYYNVSLLDALASPEVASANHIFQRQQQDPVPAMHMPELRILPLGASITRGEKSSTMNGLPSDSIRYRSQLTTRHVATVNRCEINFVLMGGM
ncbi:hypothetical protein PG991_003818 [Apiospora marii]|uniref:Uncharacterized protein n=1 Tax=Apiospora marii TaxID=335849 RepID=A0ABR1S4I9_9PEZI